MSKSHDNPLIYFQPQSGVDPSFMVWLDKDACAGEHPGAEVVRYIGGEIEGPVFADAARIAVEKRIIAMAIAEHGLMGYDSQCDDTTRFEHQVEDRVIAVTTAAAIEEKAHEIRSVIVQSDRDSLREFERFLVALKHEPIQGRFIVEFEGEGL